METELNDEKANFKFSKQDKTDSQIIMKKHSISFSWLCRTALRAFIKSWKEGKNETLK